MNHLVVSRGLALCIPMLLALMTITAIAQSSPVGVWQSSSDGKLYLVQATNAWTLVPKPISDAEVAVLAPSGEVDGAIPNPLPGSAGGSSVWQVVQTDDGSVFVVEGGDVWILVPTQATDADLSALNVVGEADGGLPSVAFSGPGTTPAAAAPAPVPPPQVVPTVASAETSLSARGRVEGAAAAIWSIQLGANRAYVLYEFEPTDDRSGRIESYGHAGATAYVRAGTNAGLLIVGGPVAFDPQASDYLALAARVAVTTQRATGAPRVVGKSMVFYAGTTLGNAGRLWRDLRTTFGPDAILMGIDGIHNQAFLDAAGTSANGTFIVFETGQSSLSGGQVKNGRFDDASAVILPAP